MLLTLQIALGIVLAVCILGAITRPGFWLFIAGTVKFISGVGAIGLLIAAFLDGRDSPMFWSYMVPAGVLLLIASLDDIVRELKS